MAYDKDVGVNGEIRYSIKSGKGKAKFKIHNSTGMVYAQKGFEAGQEYELNVRNRTLTLFPFHSYFFFFSLVLSFLS